MPRAKGFTLIELLVVITIIVVLLAMLVPALDKAIYQSELTVCGVRLKGIGTAVTVYAAENKRRYPDRMVGQKGALSPHQLFGRAGTATASTWTADCRVPLRPLFSINKSLNDPLCQEVDLDNESEMEASIWAPTALWFGYQYTNDSSTSPKGMYRLGDRWTWNDQSFDVVASDIVSQDPGWGGHDSHPDYDGVAYNDVKDSGPGELPWGSPAATDTWTRWIGGTNRGPVDANYALQDGSVRRILAIEHDTNPQIPEMADDVPIFGNGSSLWRLKVPMTGN